MKMNKLFVSGVAALAFFALPVSVFPQTVEKDAPRSINVRNNMNCTGYIQNAPVNTSLEVVGGEQEQEQNIYAEGDYIFINAGTQQGIREEARYMITRPRGNFRSPFSKKGNLGIFVQEVAVARIIRARNETSVAVLENSCDNVLLGDLLVPYAERTAPAMRNEKPLDRFALPTGKATGRIVLTRDGREMISRDQIVYLDLGSEDGVKQGDYLNVFRRLGKGDISRFDKEEVVRPEDLGFESLEFRGGKFSNQAPRKQGSEATGHIATTNRVKSRRPKDLRKVVGEVFILSVQQRTAVAVITRTAQEIHTGDQVELQ